MATLKKKEVPLAILEEMQNEVEPLFKANTLFAHLVKDEGSVYCLMDNDLESEFFFKIDSHECRAQGVIYYHVMYKPMSKHNLSSEVTWIPFAELVKRFNNWIWILKGYSEAKPIAYEDPIIKSYQAEFEKQFDIDLVDEDAEYAPFNLGQQLRIDNYLSQVKERILKLKEGKTEEEKKILEDIGNEANQIQLHLTKESKREIVKRLSKLWAKARKMGLGVLKEIFVDVASEVITKLITGGH